VDKDKCVACGQCVENCQLNAVRLGQKLCPRPTNEERPAETARNTLWGSKRYNPDFRTNRTDVMPEGTAPCKAACPAHVPVQGYIRLAAEGRYAEALELIKKEIPFPAVCGRICNKKCEEACTRGEMDAPVAELLPHCRLPRWHPYFTDIVAHDNSKAHGMEAICQHYGIRQEETLAFGDGANDIEMLEWAGIGVAMGNAADIVKAHADRVTTDVDHEGIETAVNQLI
jgi:hypothetical protein